MLLDLFLTFLKIGIFGFGGGYAMLAMILQESLRMGLTLTQFADLNSLDMIIPGPISVNAATYVGYILGGFPGSLVATAAIALPSFLLTTLYVHFASGEKSWLNLVMKRLRPVAVGLVFAAALILLSGVVFPQGTSGAGWWQQADLLSVVVVGLCLWLHLAFDVDPIILTLGSGVFVLILNLLF